MPYVTRYCFKSAAQLGNVTKVLTTIATKQYSQTEFRGQLRLQWIYSFGQLYANIVKCITRTVSIHACKSRPHVPLLISKLEQYWFQHHHPPNIFMCTQYFISDFTSVWSMHILNKLRWNKSILLYYFVPPLWNNAHLCIFVRDVDMPENGAWSIIFEDCTARKINLSLCFKLRMAPLLIEMPLKHPFQYSYAVKFIYLITSVAVTKLVTSSFVF